MRMNKNTAVSNSSALLRWLCLLMLSTFAIQADAQNESEKADRIGAILGMKFLVLDDETGQPLPEVQISVECLTPGSQGFGKKRQAFVTDQDGKAAVEMTGVFPAGTIAIQKDGWYDFHADFSGVLSRIPDHAKPRDVEPSPRIPHNDRVRDGRWRPYGEMHTIRLRRKVCPAAMVSCVINAYHLVGKEFGVDFMEGALCAPYSYGKHADLLIRIEQGENERENPRRPGHQVKTRWFTYTMRCPGEHDGICRLNGLAGSILLSTRAVPADAPFSRELVFREERGGGEQIRDWLQDDQWILVRSRTEVDDQGEIVCANYAKIYPDFFTVCNGGIEFRYYFNPEPNDIGLEFAPELNLKIDERSAYFKLR